jgi:hypothetical protein
MSRAVGKTFLMEGSIHKDLKTSKTMVPKERVWTGQFLVFRGKGGRITSHLAS